jgi:peptidoglycan hydrolase CwlO-like protein
MRETILRQEDVINRMYKEQEDLFQELSGLRTEISDLKKTIDENHVETITMKKKIKKQNVLIRKLNFTF